MLLANVGVGSCDSFRHFSVNETYIMSMEPEAEEPLADEEWLQNYRKEQEDNEDFKSELNQSLYNAVPVSESRPSVSNDLFILLSI